MTTRSMLCGRSLTSRARKAKAKAKTKAKARATTKVIQKARAKVTLRAERTTRKAKAASLLTDHLLVNGALFTRPTPTTPASARHSHDNKAFVHLEKRNNPQNKNLMPSLLLAIRHL